MNIILPVVHFSQKIWEKVIEPEISSSIINLTISSIREMQFSFKEDIGKFVSKCDDEVFLKELIEFQTGLLENEDLLKVYLDFIFGYFQKYCKENKIEIFIQEETFNIMLRW